MGSTPSRPLDLSPKDREALARVWERAGRPSLRLDPADVDAVSKAVRSAIPDAVLAVIVAEGRSLGSLVTLTRSIVEFYEASEVADWRRATKFDHVAFAEFPGGDGSEPVFACFARTKDVSSAKLVEWNLRKPGPGGERLRDVLAYLHRRDELGVGADRAKTTSSSADAAAFLPVVEATLEEPEGAALVHHPKFGDGKVLERMGDGKLRVDFGPHGVRVLAESFVTSKS